MAYDKRNLSILDVSIGFDGKAFCGKLINSTLMILCLNQVTVIISVRIHQFSALSASKFDLMLAAFCVGFL